MKNTSELCIAANWYTHLQSLHDLVGDAAAAHSANCLALQILSFDSNCCHIPLIVDDLPKTELVSQA